MVIWQLSVEYDAPFVRLFTATEVTVAVGRRPRALANPLPT
ncbi:hypothetical protein BCAR13_70034 [Paraburkholderia caribensis]|nr:hypothetical protein BCAR13_70034 [Paraburkholderia caribensis]